MCTYVHVCMYIVMYVCTCMYVCTYVIYLVSLYLFPPFQEMEETALLQCVCVFMSNFVYTTFLSIPI